MAEEQISRWRLKDLAVGEGAAARTFEADTGRPDWIDATAPGDTHLALFSDNYVDLAAGETVTLLASHPDLTHRPEDVEVRWR
jgi:hypothetical protein